MKHFNIENTFLLKTGLTVLCFLGTCFMALDVSPAYAGCVAIYSEEFIQVIKQAGGGSLPKRYSFPANVTTPSQCEAALRSAPSWSTDFRFRQTTCDCSGSSGGGGGGYSGANPAQAMALGIIGAFLNEALSPPPDTSVQDAENRQKAIKQQQAAEQAKQAAIQRWLDLQKEGAMIKKMEDEARINQGAKVLSQMQTVGGSRKLEPFSFGNPKLDLKPLSQKTYPAPSTAWEQALCAAYFSNMAKQSTKDVDARFYSDQAQSVMSGGSTYVECKIPKVSNEKLAKRMKEVRKVYDEMNVKMNDLQDIEYKISESKEKIEKAALKKEEATAKLNELQNRAATAKPEEKAEIDELTRLAQEQSQDADQEINQAKQSEKDALNKKEQLENELANMNSQAQAKIQAGDR